MKHSLKDWVIATRPWSFPASSMPVLVTIAWLFHNGIMDRWWMGLLSLINIILVHAAGNVWSDYFDFRKGVDAADTYGVRILVDGQFTPREVLCLSVTLQVLAVAMGIMMVCLTGLPLLWIGLIGIALSLHGLLCRAADVGRNVYLSRRHRAGSVVAGCACGQYYGGYPA